MTPSVKPCSCRKVVKSLPRALSRRLATAPPYSWGGREGEREGGGEEEEKPEMKQEQVPRKPIIRISLPAASYLMAGVDKAKL